MRRSHRVCMCLRRASENWKVLPRHNNKKRETNQIEQSVDQHASLYLCPHVLISTHRVPLWPTGGSASSHSRRKLSSLERDAGVESRSLLSTEIHSMLTKHPCVEELCKIFTFCSNCVSLFPYTGAVPRAPGAALVPRSRRSAPARRPARWWAGVVLQPGSAGLSVSRGGAL